MFKVTIRTLVADEEVSTRDVTMFKGFEELEPTRRLISINDGQWLVGITPPGFIGGEEVVVKLTEDQIRRFKRWLGGAGLIQDLLPELSDSEREKLITGLDDEAFAEACGPEEE
jgi:hypothetical protein